MPALEALNQQLDGELLYDEITRTAYATDASVYREMPLAVAYPKNADDLKKLIVFAHEQHQSLIPRTAGTSLAGQVVGSGIIVDVSRYMNRILEINTKERTAWVEPGVVLDELNMQLASSGLLFGPETSTGNRCMIGGMLGNNACGLHSLVYGSTREHTLAVRAILSDGSQVEFKELSAGELEKKIQLNTLEGAIYRKLNEILSVPENRNEILNQYPDPAVPRRNSGYALDLLCQAIPYHQDGTPFNLSKLLGGSEGTLAMFTAVKLHLVDIPPPEKAVVCAHFNSVNESLLANLVALKHTPTAVELMDSVILEMAASNKEQEANSFFISGKPRTILIIEINSNNKKTLQERIRHLIKDLQDQQLGYAYPVVYGEDITKVWNLRKAGLGLLSNLPGDEKSVSVIEDTAVPVKQLPEYIREMDQLFSDYNTTCVYHAHVGSGELHLRPVLNLKDPEHVVKFREIAEATVKLIKKYRGSFSGEHGDGRLRSEFIPELFGPQVYQWLKEIKMAFDPENIFNPGKIIDPVPMDQSFRTAIDQNAVKIKTYFNWTAKGGFFHAAEKCNGSGDCRKSEMIGGVMCPSYQATKDEKNTTRARANILREFIYHPAKKSIFDHPEVKEVLDLCLSCKACRSECPSSVDMARLKAEFLQQWYDLHGAPLRARLIANFPVLYRLGQMIPGLTNWFLKTRVTRFLFQKIAGFSTKRSLPLLSDTSLSRWYKKNILKIKPSGNATGRRVWFYIDEFTNYQDAGIGQKALLLLSTLGYEVVIQKHPPSARTYLSKGFVKKAGKIATSQVMIFKDRISSDEPLIGIEPSAILGFRDEFPDLVSPALRKEALELGRNCLMIDEFLAAEMRAGRIQTPQFTDEHKKILLHGHCHQKALSTTTDTVYVLSFPENFSCSEIPSGCCGMAGAFGFEKEHYELSMKVGEMVLFPAVRKADNETVICAPGTSCRHQIKDGTGKKALHPVEILFDALRP